MNLHEFIHSPAITCSPDTSLAAATAEMDRYNVGSLVIVDANGGITGILTDRDVAVRGMAKRRGPDTPVSEIMTTNVISLREDADLFDAARQMATSGCRRLPVETSVSKAAHARRNRTPPRRRRPGRVWQ